MAKLESVVIDRERLRAIADLLRKKYGAQRVILFGSAARGEATEHSDIDLLVIAPTTEKFYKRMAAVHQTVRELGRGLPIAPIVLTPEELKTRLERGDQFIEEVITTGVDL